LSVGGTEEDSFTDMPLCRNGQDDYILRGSTLAGALLRTAKTLYSEDKLSTLTGGGRQRNESLWQFYHSKHSPQNVHTAFRQGVAIRHDTGAAAEGALYDLDLIAKGTDWFFMLEVNTFDPGGLEAEAIALQALAEWQKGRCWLGRNIARGMGWLRLKELNVWQLTTEHYDIWPDSSVPLPNSLKKLTQTLAITQLQSFQDLLKQSYQTYQNIEPNPLWFYCEVTVAIKVGKKHDGYGLDALSVGAHESMPFAWDEHFLKPEGMQEKAIQEDFEPGHVLAMTASGTPEPFIPGSSLRGVLRHELSRYLNTECSEKIVDPDNGDVPETDRVGQIFGTKGTKARSAKLLIRDAYLKKGSDWQAVLLQRHAEDEFTASTFASSKFNQLLIVEGEFETRFCLEGRKKEGVEQQWKDLLIVLQKGHQGHLPIGGQQWQGSGWVSWEITNKPVIKPAGVRV